MGGMEGIKGERSEQQSDKAENHHQNGVDLSPFDVEKVRFLIKMLCGYIRNCASYAGGEHIFRKFMKTSCWKVKDGANIMSDTSKYHQHGVGNIKMSSK